MEKLKISAATWDSDRDPNGGKKWIQNMGSLVRATKHGLPLEEFLDRKLGRDVHKPATVPSFITSDPEFAVHPPGAPAAAATVSSTTSTTSTSSTTTSSGAAPGAAPPTASAPATSLPGGPDVATSLAGSTAPAGPFVLKSAGLSYWELPAESKEMDALMYNVLLLNLKGSKAHLLRSVTMPSYVQAICVLAKHIDLSRNDRKTKAFEAMRKLELKGDVHEWQIQAVAALGELQDSKCTILDFALICVMDSLGGKSKTMQYKVAEDINKMEINDSTNVYDMIQNYAAAIASVGDAKPKPVNSAKAGKDFKKKEKQQAEQEESDSSSSDDGSDEFQGYCNHCHKWGHKWVDCPARRRGKSKKKYYKDKYEKSKDKYKDKDSDKDKEAAATEKSKEAPGFTAEQIKAMVAQLSKPPVTGHKCGIAI